MVNIQGIGKLRYRQRTIDIVDISQVARHVVSENKLRAIRSEIFLDDRRTCHRNNSTFTSFAVTAHPNRIRDSAKRNTKTKILGLRRRSHSINVTTVIKLDCGRIVAVATALDDSFPKNTAIRSPHIIGNNSVLKIPQPVRNPFLYVSAHIAKITAKTSVRTNVFRFKIRIQRIPLRCGIPIPVCRQNPFRFRRHTVRIDFRMEYETFHRNAIPDCIKIRRRISISCIVTFTLTALVSIKDYVIISHLGHRKQIRIFALATFIESRAHDGLEFGTSNLVLSHRKIVI